MSKIISFKGQLPPGEQDRINLKTKEGKVGYKITKFQLISKTPGADADVAFVGQIFKTDQTGNITASVDFSDSDLLAVSFYNAEHTTGRQYETIIFDNEKFNQDIFINITDADGGTKRCNYYIELEAMSLTDLETTMLTLQSIRQVTAP